MPQSSIAVETFCRALWGVREQRGGRIEARGVQSFGRMLCEVCQAQCRESAGYSPEEDTRVLWAREVLAAARRGERQCLASGDLEALTAHMLKLDEEHEPSGRDRAAGIS